MMRLRSTAILCLGALVISGGVLISMMLLHYTILASGALHRDFSYLSIWSGGLSRRGIVGIGKGDWHS